MGVALFRRGLAQALLSLCIALLRRGLTQAWPCSGIALLKHCPLQAEHSAIMNASMLFFFSHAQAVDHGS
eukprot:2266587-Karenia_brevis.AAC.1